VHNDGIQSSLATDRGVIQATSVIAHGGGYTSDPIVDVFHGGTDIQVNRFACIVANTVSCAGCSDVLKLCCLDRFLAACTCICL
jgi:hypothetical protein